MHRRLAVIAGAVSLIAGHAALAAPAASKARFLLLLNEDAAYQASRVEGSADRIAEYSAWAKGLADSGKLAAGEKLKNEGRVLHGATRRAVSVSDLPGGRPGGLAGYFVIAAADLREAEAIALTCPHLKYGGTVVVRPIEDLEP